MSNLFNTPSSFGFNTESSYSPDLRNGRQNLSYQDLVQSINEQQDYEEQNDDNKIDQQDQNADQMLEKVYAGLTNIEKTKILTVIFRILSNKVYFRYFYAFGVLAMRNKYKPTNLQNKKYHLAQHHKLYLLLRHHIKSSQYHTVAKKLAFRKLQSFLDQSRHKELKVMYLLSNLTASSYTHLLRHAFNQWKHLNKSILGHKYKNNKKLSLNFVSKKKQMACKLLLAIARKLLCSQFNKLKYTYRISEKKKESLIENSGKTRKNSSSSFKNKSPNISASVISTSYTNQMMNTKKMIKMPQRSVEVKSGVKNYARICYTMSLNLSKILMKRKRQFFNCLVDNYKDEQKVEQNDEPTIYTNILKHLCWLYSKEPIRQKGQKSMDLERIKNQMIREVLRKRKVTWKEEIIKIIRNWSRRALEEKIIIMKEVKRLQNIKYNFVESYK